MTALNKQALHVPERKRRDWSQAVMRDCDFCSQWSLTIHHEDCGCICASCCDAEYTSELKGVLESAIERAEAAEKRIAELEAPTTNINIPDGWAMVPINPTMAQEYAGYKTLTDTGKMSRLMKTRIANIYRAMITTAAGIGVKGE